MGRPDHPAVVIFEEYLAAISRRPRRAEALRAMLSRRNLNVQATRPLASGEAAEAIEAFGRYARAIEGRDWDRASRPIGDLRKLGVLIAPRTPKCLAGPRLPKAKAPERRSNPGDSCSAKVAGDDPTRPACPPVLAEGRDRVSHHTS